MESTGPAKERRIYQFRVELPPISPAIWRRIRVWEDYTLGQLHRVLQVTMGWENYHLYEFRIDGDMYRDPHPENEREILNAKAAKLRGVLGGAGTEFEYLYDFGDGWRHNIVLESIVSPEPGELCPRCVGGERSCPPEDVGGPYGYEEYLHAMANPKHGRHKEMMEWRGPFDPEAFSIEKVNETLEKKFRPRRKPTAREESRKRLTLSPEEREVLQRVLSGAEFRENKPIRIKPGEKVPLGLTERERELILKYTSADEDLTNRLRLEPMKHGLTIFGFSLDELEELAGFVAAEANHARSKKLEKGLDELCDRIQATLDRYTDDATIN